MLYWAAVNTFSVGDGSLIALLNTLLRMFVDKILIDSVDVCQWSNVYC